MNAPLDMYVVRLRQQQRSARAFHIDLLADVELAMRCYLRGYSGVPGMYEHLRTVQRALEERITAEGAVRGVHADRSAA